ncbi:MAG: threonine--tRNA ligase, partial [Atopobiaceae bacterium]|nr:threonine--tRNA ligase [Atopobiaceae bacterium]
MKVLYNDGHVAEVAPEEELHVIRHSASHILAQAIKRLYPEADFGYGPATENGFYYDIDLPEGVKLSEDDFPAIQAEMRKICKENLKFETYELPREEAIAHMQERGEKYKVEHIGDLDPDARITFYKQGEYVDMCVGPHLMYTTALKAFKLTGVSGAYWKNDSKNKMLTR